MSFNTSSIQSDTYTANVQINAPKHVVGTVELTEDAGALNVDALSINTDLLNSDYVVSSVSVTTPLLVGDVGFPVTVQNLKTVTLNSGAGTVGQVLALDSSLDLVWANDANTPQGLASVLATSNDADAGAITNLAVLGLTSGAGTDGQVLALDSSLNLVWKDDANTPQGLESVLTVSNDAGALEITNLQKLTPTSGAGTVGQVLSCDSSGNLDWVTLTKPATPSLQDVLGAGNDANNLAIVNALSVQAKSLNLLNSADWTIGANASTSNLDVSTTTGGYLNLGSVSAITTGQIMASLLVGKKPSYDYWVSPNGSNIDAVSNGGSLENPFLTIGACINYCESLTAVDNEYRYIHVLGGNYNESFTITKKVYLMGESVTSQSASVGCSISGTITVNVNANGGDIFSNGVHISGLLLDGWINNITNVNHMLILENVYIYAPNDTSGRALYHNSTATNSRLKLWNCQLISGGSSGLDPLLEIASSSLVSMNYVSMSAKGNQTCLLMTTTATCDSINNCKFENSNSAGLTAQPIVKITANVSGTYTFSNCAFVYSNASDKTANPNASGILNQNTSGNNTILSLYNTFVLSGTNTNNNYAIQDINHASPTQMICLYFMSNALPNSAFAIHGTNNQNKFQLVPVS